MLSKNFFKKKVKLRFNQGTEMVAQFKLLGLGPEQFILFQVKIDKFFCKKLFIKLGWKLKIKLE